jgi:hypothetical protein
MSTNDAQSAPVPAGPDRSPQCGECTNGVLIGFTYGYAEIPDGATAVQRCDECQRFESDQDAAVALARSWSTDWGIAGDPSAQDAPGDWWVRLPTSSRRDPFLSESAAVQAWIDGTHVPCLACQEPLDRTDGTWRHQTPSTWCTYTQSAIAWLTDAQALDQISGLLAAEEWSGADFLDVINDLVIRTGRPAGMAAHRGWYEEPGAIEDGE